MKKEVYNTNLTCRAMQNAALKEFKRHTNKGSTDLDSKPTLNRYLRDN